SAPPGNAMVGMDLVMAPGIVREHHVWLVLPDNPAYLATELHRWLEIAVLMPEEHEFLDPDDLAGGALFGLARLRHLRGTHLRIVRSLLPARDDAVGAVGSGARVP